MMNSIFKLLSCEQWEEAKITGIIPKSDRDNNDNCIHVVQFDDLCQACLYEFQSEFPSEIHPIALEFAPDSCGVPIDWQQPTADKPWLDGKITVGNLMADQVLNIYSLEPQRTDDGLVYRVLGES